MWWILSKTRVNKENTTTRVYKSFCEKSQQLLAVKYFRKIFLKTLAVVSSLLILYMHNIQYKKKQTIHLKCLKCLIDCECVSWCNGALYLNLRRKGNWLSVFCPSREIDDQKRPAFWKFSKFPEHLFLIKFVPS